MTYGPGHQRRLRVPQKDKQSWRGTYQEFQVFVLPELAYSTSPLIYS